MTKEQAALIIYYHSIDIQDFDELDADLANAYRALIKYASDDEDFTSNT